MDGGLEGRAMCGVLLDATGGRFPSSEPEARFQLGEVRKVLSTTVWEIRRSRPW